VTVRARWVTLRARWVTLRARWVTLRARRVTCRCTSCRWACTTAGATTRACGGSTSSISTNATFRLRVLAASAKSAKSQTNSCVALSLSLSSHISWACDQGYPPQPLHPCLRLFSASLTSVSAWQIVLGRACIARTRLTGRGWGTLGQVEPNILWVNGKGGDGTGPYLVAFLRSRGSDIRRRRIFRSESEDGGRSWSDPLPTRLPNFDRASEVRHPKP
jgi:hypothetical protein